MISALASVQVVFFVFFPFLSILLFVRSFVRSFLHHSHRCWFTISYLYRWYKRWLCQWILFLRCSFFSIFFYNIVFVILVSIDVFPFAFALIRRFKCVRCYYCVLSDRRAFYHGHMLCDVYIFEKKHWDFVEKLVEKARIHIHIEIQNAKERRKSAQTSL